MSLYVARRVLKSSAAVSASETDACSQTGAGYW